MAAEAALGERERAVLQRLADRVVELRLEVPALLTLETTRPLSLVAGQAMLFFEPLVQALFRIEDYRLLAGLVERREAMEVLARMIETGADEAHARRRAAGKAPPPAPRS
jgi:hypothetical protein